MFLKNIYKFQEQLSVIKVVVV